MSDFLKPSLKRLTGRNINKQYLWGIVQSSDNHLMVRTSDKKTARPSSTQCHVKDSSVILSDHTWYLVSNQLIWVFIFSPFTPPIVLSPVFVVLQHNRAASRLAGDKTDQNLTGWKIFCSFHPTKKEFYQILKSIKTKIKW